MRDARSRGGFQGFSDCPLCSLTHSLASVACAQQRVLPIFRLKTDQELIHHRTCSLICTVEFLCNSVRLKIKSSLDLNCRNCNCVKNCNVSFWTSACRSYLSEGTLSVLSKLLRLRIRIKIVLLWKFQFYRAIKRNYRGY